MTQIAFTGKKITEDKLKYNKVQRTGGLVTIDLPIISCNLASEHETLMIEVGGYKSFINYNKHREKQHKKEKEQKRLRSLKRQQKRIGGCSTYEELPSYELTNLNSSGREHKS